MQQIQQTVISAFFTIIIFYNYNLIWYDWVKQEKYDG